jgi:uncharacterized SAM-binding protein YcdF (DUF218 family)
MRRILPSAGRVSVRLAAVYGLLLALVLYTPVTDWFAYPLLPPTDDARGDVIVVLSAWATSAGELNESGVRRAMVAARLYHSGVAPYIVVTGRRPLSTDEGDALEASRRLLGELGVPPAATTIEDHSANTRDSAVNVGKLARERGWNRLVLVTDATHMRRTRLAFARERLQISCMPTMLWEIGGERPSIRLAKLGAVVHEYGGILYYWSRGWI